jgi:3-oxoacyl-[acyl-carrier protein] reductase
MDVEGRLIVVTGATSGIGRATAERLAAEGGRVALLARTESDLESVAQGIREQGGTASVHLADLAERESVEATAERIRADVGDPDVLVNSAGVGSWVSAWEADPDRSSGSRQSPSSGRSTSPGRSCRQCWNGTRAAS